MAKAFLEFNGDHAILKLHTHLDTYCDIECHKEPHQTFRLGGTACDSPLDCYPCQLISITGDFEVPNKFIGTGILSCKPEDVEYCLEYYDLDMEGKPPGWLLLKEPIYSVNQIFVNVDCIDGGGNVVKRYRISPFTGHFKVM